MPDDEFNEELQELQEQHNFCLGELSEAIKQFRLIPVLGEDMFHFSARAPDYRHPVTGKVVQLANKTLDEVLGEIFSRPVKTTPLPPASPPSSMWIDKDFVRAAGSSTGSASVRPFEAHCRRRAGSREISRFVQEINQVVNDLYGHLDLSLLQRVFGWEMPLIMSMTIDGVTERYRAKHHSEYASISLIDGRDNGFGSGDTVTDAVLHCFGSCYPGLAGVDHVAISASSIARAISQFCLINEETSAKQGVRPALGRFLRGSNRQLPVYLFLGTNFSAYPAYFLKSFLESAKTDCRIFVASRHSLSDSNVLALLDQFERGRIRLLALPPAPPTTPPTTPPPAPPASPPSPAGSSDYLDDLFTWLEVQKPPRVQETKPVVFLSYTRVTEIGTPAEDSKNKARALYDALAADGRVIPILDEEKLDAGEELTTEIRRHIYRSDLFVIVGTSSYLERCKSSGQSMNWLRRELALAKRNPIYEEAGSRIFPIWTEEGSSEDFRNYLKEELNMLNPLIQTLIIPPAMPNLADLAGSSALINLISIAERRYTARTTPAA